MAGGLILAAQSGGDAVPASTSSSKGMGRRGRGRRLWWITVFLAAAGTLAACMRG